MLKRNKALIRVEKGLGSVDGRDEIIGNVQLGRKRSATRLEVLLGLCLGRGELLEIILREQDVGTSVGHKDRLTLEKPLGKSDRHKVIHFRIIALNIKRNRFPTSTNRTSR